METGLLANEDSVRLTAFLAVLSVMAVWELAAPRRRLDVPRLIRWSNNLALVVVDAVIVRLAFPVLADDRLHRDRCARRRGQRG